MCNEPFYRPIHVHGLQVPVNNELNLHWTNSLESGEILRPNEKSLYLSPEVHQMQRNS